MQPLGTIEALPLRTIWQDEARDFTPWLATEGLALIGDILGVELELVATECAVGGYRADILAKLATSEEEEEHLVVIENQLEITNHDHLGKIITYAAGHEAITLVWVAADFRDEHRQAMDWLNEHLDGVSCFALQITAIRIGDSAPAPQFKLIASPNEWARVVRRSAAGREELSETRLERIRFWEELREYGSRQRGPNPFTRKAAPRSYYDVRMGRSDIVLNLGMLLQQQLQRITFYVQTDNAKEIFDQLYRQRESIEAQLGNPLVWDRGEDSRKSIQIFLERPRDFLDPVQREQALQWFYEKTEDFPRVFTPLIRNM